MNKGEFLNRLCTETGFTDKDRAERAAESVLSRLHQRIEPDEAAHVEAQLPEGLKPLWNGGMLGKAAHRVTGARDFGLDDMVMHVCDDVGVDRVEAERVMRSVMHLLKEQISDGEVRHVASQLPSDIRAEWERA